MSLLQEAMTGRAIIRHRGLKMTDQITVLHLRMTDPGILHRRGIMKKDQVLLRAKETTTQVEAMTDLAILLPKGTTTRAGAMTGLAILRPKEVNHLPAPEALLHPAGIQVPPQVEAEAVAAVVHGPLREAKEIFFKQNLFNQNKVSTSVHLVC